MNDQAIWRATEALCALLQDAARAVPGARVSPEPPDGLGGDTVLDVHLYAVIPDEAFRHQDRFPREDDLPVLPLRLRYLVTAHARDARTAQVLLGAALSCLYGRDFLDDPAAGTPTRLRPRIALVEADLDELDQAWARRTPPRPPCLIYEVGPVFVDGADADPET